MATFSSLAYLRELASTSKTARLAVTSADGLVARIRDGILSGDIKPGDFLGSERDIADQYAVSRNTAREALRSLAAQGAVDIRVGVKGGATVAQGDPEIIGQTLALQHCLTGVPYDEVLEIQAVLEALAAELAATNATPGDLDRLANLLAEAESLADDPFAFSRSSLAFHLAIADASHNRALFLQLQGLTYVIWPPNYARPHDGVADSVLTAHRSLYALIKDGDANGAHDFMRDHISHIRNQKNKLSSGKNICC